MLGIIISIGFILCAILLYFAMMRFIDFMYPPVAKKKYHIDIKWKKFKCPEFHLPVICFCIPIMKSNLR